NFQMNRHMLNEIRHKHCSTLKYTNNKRKFPLIQLGKLISQFFCFVPDFLLRNEDFLQVLFHLSKSPLYASDNRKRITSTRVVFEEIQAMPECLNRGIHSTFPIRSTTSGQHCLRSRRT